MSVCVYCVGFGAATAAAAVGRKRYELDVRRANGRTRTCSKSTQGHTLKNRDYILNLLSLHTCSRASHISFMPTKIELSVYTDTACRHIYIYQYIPGRRPHSWRWRTVFFSSFFFLFLRISLLSFRYWIDFDCHCPFKNSNHENEKKTHTHTNGGEKTNAKRRTLKLSTILFSPLILFAP